MTKKREISEIPPSLDEHHVRLPDQLAGLLSADRAHLRGITGRSVRVAVIDSGFFPHPFYVSRGYRISWIQTDETDTPDVDEYGHGTAQLASVFSIAPEAHVLAIKCLAQDPSEALRKAISLKPHVISCAWGFNIDLPGATRVPSQHRTLQRLIRKAVDEGICVVAAAGNGQQAFPASMPEVIAAGGVYYGPDGGFSPSDIASYFESSIFPGRQVPDVCGVVGNGPEGRLLLVPVPPTAKLAKRHSFASIAAGAASSVGKGWAMFSGTSAATAMISGACALILQSAPGLPPKLVKQVLIDSGRVIKGEEVSCKLLDMEVALQQVDDIV